MLNEAERRLDAAWQNAAGILLICTTRESYPRHSWSFWGLGSTVSGFGFPLLWTVSLLHQRGWSWSLLPARASTDDGTNCTKGGKIITRTKPLGRAVPEACSVSLLHMGDERGAFRRSLVCVGQGDAFLVRNPAWREGRTSLHHLERHLGIRGHCLGEMKLIPSQELLFEPSCPEVPTCCETFSTAQVFPSQRPSEMTLICGAFTMIKMQITLLEKICPCSHEVYPLLRRPGAWRAPCSNKEL